jgi:hypothetical protein
MKILHSQLEIIKTYFRNKIVFFIYSVPMVIFQIFKEQFLRIVHTLVGSFFPTFTLMEEEK